MNGTVEMSAIRQAKIKSDLRKENIGEPIEKIEKQRQNH